MWRGHITAHHDTGLTVSTGGAGAEDSTIKLTLVHDAGVYGASRYNDENGGAVVLLTERAVLRARALLLRSVHRFAQHAFHRWAEYADMFVVRVTRQQFIAAMGAKTSIAWASSLFDEYDANGDGSVSQAELEAAMVTAAAMVETKQASQPAGVNSGPAVEHPPAKVAWAAAEEEQRTAKARSGQRTENAEVEGGDISAVDDAQGEEAGEGGEPLSATEGGKGHKARVGGVGDRHGRGRWQSTCAGSTGGVVGPEGTRVWRPVSTRVLHCRLDVACRRRKRRSRKAARRKRSSSCRSPQTQK